MKRFGESKDSSYLYHVEINKKLWQIKNLFLKYWYQQGKLNREDGPAVEYANGHKEWWINDERFTEKEFRKRTRHIIQEMTVDEVCKALGKTIKIVK